MEISSYFYEFITMHESMEKAGSEQVKTQISLGRKAHPRREIKLRIETVA